MISINNLVTNTMTIGGSSGHADTWYKYANDTEWRTVSISESIAGDEWEARPTNQIPNVSNVIALEIGTGVTSIGAWAFGDCGRLTNVTIPDSVTSIGDSAFRNCSNLTSLTIGNSVESIGSGAFSGCSGLTNVTIPDSVTNIGEGAFYNCTGLTSLTIGNSVESIGSGAFSGCSGLTNVTIPDSVTNIGEGAFLDCDGLTSVTIGNGVENIGADAFYESTAISDVYCYPNPANLTWNEDGKDDFKSDGTTVCHVKSEYLSAYESKFGSEVNVTFAGDLT